MLARLEKLIKNILRDWRGYLLAISLVALATWLKYLAQPKIIPADVPILYMLAIVPTAIFFGLGPSILVSILSLVAYDFFFISPVHTFVITHITNPPILLIFLAVGVLFSYLSSNLRRKNRIAIEEIVARTQTEEELIKYKDHLENIVKQRTTELEETNLSLQDEITQHRRAEQRDSFLSAIVESSDDAIIGKTLEGVITSWNKGAEKTYGYTEAEVIGKSILMLAPPDSAEEVQRFLEQIKRGERIQHFETLRVKRDGTTFPVSLTISPILDSRGQIIGASTIAQDIAERKKAEQALKESEQRLHLAQDAANAGTWEWDLLTNKNYWSEEIWELYQLEPHSCEPSYDAWAQSIHPNDRLSVERTVQEAAKKGTKLNIEWRVNCRPGEKRWLMSIGRPMLEADGTFTRYIGIVLDITERKRMEEEFNRQARVLDTVIANTGTMLVYLDPDFNFVMANQAYINGCGHTWEELNGKNHFYFFPNVENESIFRKVRDTGEPVTFHDKPFEYADQPWRGITYWDWTLVPIKDSLNQVTGLVFSLIDTTERKRMEQTIEYERDKLIRILNSMEDAVCIMNQNFSVEYINPSMQSQFGDIDGQKCYHYFNGRDDACPWCNNSELPGGKIMRKEFQSNRTGRTYEVTETPLKNPDGTISKLAILHDITERKKVEQLKDDFIGMVSHEMRTPLTVITGAVAVAADERISSEEKRELLNEAGAAADNLADILENLLELSRYQANRLRLEMKPTNLAEIAQQVVEEFRRLSSNHNIQLAIPDDFPQLVIDPVRLNRVFHNLIENATKYSPEGNKIQIFARQERGEVVVGISDHGPGISVNDQRKLFEPFQRLETKSNANGIGLGLVVCKRLLEAHGGRIWVESKPGEGATFFFTIPFEK